MILLRTLKKDYARYSKDEEMDDMVCEDLTLTDNSHLFLIAF